MGRRRAPYPPDFRRQRVELVEAGRTPEELGREFEPTPQAICNWVRQAGLDEAHLQRPALNLQRERSEPIEARK